MKDATGELSMTAIAVVAIAAIGVFFTTLIWPTVKTNIMRNVYCESAFNCNCASAGNGSGMCACYYCPNDSAVNSAADVGCADPKPISCAKNAN